MNQDHSYEAGLEEFHDGQVDGVKPHNNLFYSYIYMGLSEIYYFNSSHPIGCLAPPSLLCPNNMAKIRVCKDSYIYIYIE